MALGLLILLSAAFMGGMNTLRNLDRKVSDDYAGLLTVDNTIERLAMKKHYNAADITRVFRDEFARSGLASYDRLKPVVRNDADAVVLAVIRRNGKNLIEVKIKCQP